MSGRHSSSGIYQSWLTVSDTQSLQGFYEGEATFYTKHNFSVWMKPLAFWGLFLPDYDVHDACASIRSSGSRWAEQEKLAYPIIQLPLGACQRMAVLLLLKNRMMWVGFSIAVVIGVINGVHYLFPAVSRDPLYQTDSRVPKYFHRPSVECHSWDAYLHVYPFRCWISIFPSA